jgi:hypothetical protein
MMEEVIVEDKGRKRKKEERHRGRECARKR